MPRPPFYTTINFNNPAAPWLERFIWCWSQWDSNWYISIAGQGYVNDQTVAFYPLYPLLLRWLGFILSLGQPTTESYIIAGVIIAAITTLIVCIILVKLLMLDYNEEMAKNTLIFLLAFPTAFYLLAVYTESLFMALSVGAFFAARQNHWVVAMALVALAVITRQQGIVVGIALVFEYGQQTGWNWRKINLRTLVSFSFPVISLSGWLTWNWLTFGNFFAPVTATQNYWGRSLAWPWKSVLAQVGGLLYRDPGKSDWNPLTQYWDAMPVFDFTVTLVFIVLAIFSFRFLQNGQLRISYFIYSLGCLLLPLSSPASDDPLHSLPRYLLLSFPTFITITLLSNRSRLFKQGWLAISIGLSGMLIARFSLGYWIA